MPACKCCKDVVTTSNEYPEHLFSVKPLSVFYWINPRLQIQRTSRGKEMKDTNRTQTWPMSLSEGHVVRDSAFLRMRD